MSSWVSALFTEEQRRQDKIAEAARRQEQLEHTFRNIAAALGVAIQQACTAFNEQPNILPRDRGMDVQLDGERVTVRHHRVGSIRVFANHHTHTINTEGVEVKDVRTDARRPMTNQMQLQWSDDTLALTRGAERFEPTAEGAAEGVLTPFFRFGLEVMGRCSAV